jgi:NADH dehydrogenase
VGFFVYDASTYGSPTHLDALPVSTLALNPRRGGPKNLPIAEHFLDDGDNDNKYANKHKTRLLILGTGWGSVALLKGLNPEDYHITVVSPSNQFLFTPMLPSATVGTLELRSLVEPIRKIINRVHGHFLKAMAVDVAFSDKLVEVEAADASGKTVSFYVPYDKLIIACGEYTAPSPIPTRLILLPSRICDESSWRAWIGELSFPQRHP